MANTEQFDMNTDYSALMKQAADNKDWASAAKYENLRNQKIDAMNANGTNTGNYEKSNTYNYAGLNNTSYNGSYYTPDLNTDYQALINKSRDEGDLSSAAKYEALRNAKISYLDSIGQGNPEYKQTENFVKNYSGNNRGGTAYTSAFDNILGTVPNEEGRYPDWKYANINGSEYKNENGMVYIKTGEINGQPNWLAKGNYKNPETNEWGFYNQDDARVAAVNNYLMNNFTNKQYKDNEEAYNALLANGSIDNNYIKNIKNGSFYSSAEKEANRRQEQRAQEFNNGFNNLNSNQQNTIISNSFETDLNSGNGMNAGYFGNSYNANINPYYSGYYGIHYSPYQDWRRQQEYRAYV